MGHALHGLHPASPLHFLPLFKTWPCKVIMHQYQASTARPPPLTIQSSHRWPTRLPPTALFPFSWPPLSPRLLPSSLLPSSGISSYPLLSPPTHFFIDSASLPPLLLSASLLGPRFSIPLLASSQCSPPLVYCPLFFYSDAFRDPLLVLFSSYQLLRSSSPRFPFLLLSSCFFSSPMLRISFLFPPRSILTQSRLLIASLLSLLAKRLASFLPSSSLVLFPLYPQNVHILASSSLALPIASPPPASASPPLSSHLPS